MAEAVIQSTAKKAEMLTEMRRLSRGFRNDLDVKQEVMVGLANKANFKGTDIIVNKSTALTIGMCENMDKFDVMLDQVAEDYLSFPLLEDEVKTKLKNFMDERKNLVFDYPEIHTDTTNESYDAKLHGEPLADTINTIGTRRATYMLDLSEQFKNLAGTDISDEIRIAFKNLEDSCNEFAEELNKVIDEQAAIDERLKALNESVGSHASALKLNSVAEKKKEFGSVPDNDYVGDL